MRPPNRNFVVEFKSRSRRPRDTGPASIWGNMDLKAVAREVEELTSHLVVQVPGEPEVHNALPDQAEPPASSALDSDSAALQSNAQDPSVDQSAAAPLPVQSVPSITSEQDMGRTYEVSPPNTDVQRVRKTSRQKKAPSPVPTSRVPKTMPIADVVPNVSRSELNALSAENQQLKAALRDLLLSENSRLRVMLARFP